MKAVRRFLTCCTCLALLWCAALCWGQEITGNIVGTVSDPSGAVVPGATVTVRNTSQNIVVRTLKTNADGNYVATHLPVGHYSVTVEASGFKTFVQKEIILNVNDKITINVALQVGAAAQTVEVEANPVMVDLQSATTAGLVTGDQIRNLTLNNRVYLQLATLMPGVSNTGGDQFYVGTTNPFGSTNVLGISVNGSRTSSNNWTIDGADNVDRGSNLTLVQTPSVDAVAEFKILKSNYDPEFGRAGGAQVNVITRSGTSSFHGGAYEFWRNNLLNADTYFNKQNSRYFHPTAACEEKYFPGQSGIPTPDCDTRTPQRYNNFGWTFGGPLTIPGVYNVQKDKTFFFFSQEYRRAITYAMGSSVALPTQAELDGSLPAPVCIEMSSTGCVQTGRQIANISPLAQAYIKDIWSKMPLPTDPNNAYNRFNFRNTINFRQEILKIDHVFGPRLAAYVRYEHDSIPTTEPMGLFGPNSYLPGVGDTATNSPGWSLVGRANATISPNTLLEVGYNFTYGAIVSHPTGLMAAKNSPDIQANLPFPTTLDSVPGIGSSYFAGLGTHPRYDDYNRNHQILANFSHVMGRHNFKAGATYHHYQKTENAAGSNAGSFVFRYYGYLCNQGFNADGTCIGYLDTDGTMYTNTQLRMAQSWANFLLGQAYSFSQASLDLFPDIRDNQWEFYGQDEFRLRKNLTITYGLRYSLFRQPTDASGLLTNFDPKYYDPAQAPQIDPASGYIVNPGTSNLLNGIAPSAPALDYCQKLLANGQVTYCWPQATKAAYGNKAGAEYNRAFAPRVGIAWDPFGDGKTSIRSGFGLFYDTGLFGIVEQNSFSNPPFVNTLSISGTTNGRTWIPFDNPTGSLQISSVPKTGQSRIDPNYHTPYTEMWNLGVQRNLTPTTLVDVAYVGSRSNHLLGEEDLNQPQVGEYLNYPQLGDATTGMISPTLLNYIRPYKGWGPIVAIRTQFMANYNSLQSSLTKRFKGASQVGLAYTWSHALTDNQTDRSTAPRDTYHPRLEYAPTQQDRRHIFSANFVWELPWLRSQQGFLGQVLGGWEVSGITSAMTGVPLFVYDNISDLDMPGQGCQGSATPCYIFPDQISTDIYGYTGPTKSTTSTYSIWQWFNPNAFASVPSGQVRVGNARRGAVYGPGNWRQDLTMMKNFKFGERFSLQFRADAFNVFNHTNPSGVDAGFGDTGAFDQVTFGTITSTRDPRIMQLGLKLNF